MRTFGKWLGRILLALVVLIGAVWVLAPREPVDTEVSFNANVLNGDLDSYLRDAEARFEDLTPGVEKRIIWAGNTGEQTDYSVVYLHGYSATSEEIRPVPDQLAEALGANLYYARLTGHGQSGDALAEATAGDWIEDTAEALAIGREIGREVLVLSTSTGGTLAAIAATQPELVENVKGIAFLSPNFAIQNPAAMTLTWPFVRQWAPIVAGPERSFEPMNDGHATYWTTRYPTVAVVPMAALVKYARELDYDDVTTPALFMFSDSDLVVSPETVRDVAGRWGGPVQLEPREMGEGDDPFHHVIAGDILSPGQTAETVEILKSWAEGL